MSDDSSSIPNNFSVESSSSTPNGDFFSKYMGHFNTDTVVEFPDINQPKVSGRRHTLMNIPNPKQHRIKEKIPVNVDSTGFPEKPYVKGAKDINDVSFMLWEIKAEWGFVRNTLSKYVADVQNIADFKIGKLSEILKGILGCVIMDVMPEYSNAKELL